MCVRSCASMHDACLCVRVVFEASHVCTALTTFHSTSASMCATPPAYFFNSFFTSYWNRFVASLSFFCVRPANVVCLLSRHLSPQWADRICVHLCVCVSVSECMGRKQIKIDDTHAHFMNTDNWIEYFCGFSSVVAVSQCLSPHCT